MAATSAINKTSTTSQRNLRDGLPGQPCGNSWLMRVKPCLLFNVDQCSLPMLKCGQLGEARRTRQHDRICKTNPRMARVV